MLFSSFFPASSSETRIPIDDLDYPPNMFDYQPITDEQIRRAIHKLNPFKAPGANGIPNIVIKQCADTLIPFIGPIFHTTFSLEVYLDTWKDSITRVVKNLGKPNYRVPGAYRPIALLDTISKVLLSCMAEDLIKMSKK